MDTRKNVDKPIKMTSACDVLKKLLSHHPAADTLPFFKPSDMYTKSTNNLTRAKMACELDLVLSSRSTKDSLIFVTRDEYPQEILQTSNAHHTVNRFSRK